MKKYNRINVIVMKGYINKWFFTLLLLQLICNILTDKARKKALIPRG